MVDIFGFKLFECSKCNMNKKHSTRRRRRGRGYKGGYTYKNMGRNNAGEDVSNVPSASSRKRSRSHRSMNMSDEESKKECLLSLFLFINNY
jgi:hypothetical protein